MRVMGDKRGLMQGRRGNKIRHMNAAEIIITIVGER